MSECKGSNSLGDRMDPSSFLQARAGQGMQRRSLSNSSDTHIVQRSSSVWWSWPTHKLAGDTSGPNSLLHGRADRAWQRHADRATELRRQRALGNHSPSISQNLDQRMSAQERKTSRTASQTKKNVRLCSQSWSTQGDSGIQIKFDRATERQCQVAQADTQARGRHN